MLVGMGDRRSVLEGRPASMDGSCSWTSVCASRTQLASLNRQHLDFLPVYDRSMVSVGRQIGEGGQGCVYEAKLHLPYCFTPLPVVVKKFKPFVGVSQGHFPREMFSTKINNLCVPYGVFFEGESLCMIMRRFSCDLRAAIDYHMKALRDEGFDSHGPIFTERVTRSIILQLAKGLKSLHECGVYHGDLKATNILLRNLGKNHETSLSRPSHLAIADFERSEGVVGTAFWRAPEVLRSLATDIPLSKEQWLLADVYSFGMVCYEILTGLIPFEGHLISDYGLVLNGGRPKLPDHVPKPMRDLIVRCWHAHPHSRPNWNEIIKVLVLNDDPLTHDAIGGQIDNLGSVEPSSFESLIHESKKLVQDLTMLYGSGSKSFGSEFMPYYWASEFLASVDEYASKLEVGSIPEGPLMCDVQEVFERSKLGLTMMHQMNGVGFGFSRLLDMKAEQIDTHGFGGKIMDENERLHGMLIDIYQIVSQAYINSNKIVECTRDFGIGTSWTGRLLYFHALVKWFLWYEDVEGGRVRPLVMKHLTPTHVSWNSRIQALLMFICMIVNAYFYVLAMITYEPILLGLQYVLYKTKGCNNILYRSCGRRICRFQRVWMHSTRCKLLSIILSFSYVSLLTMYGWRGILGWTLLPCMIIYTPYWRRPVTLPKSVK